VSRTQIPEEQWEEVAQRNAKGESLRQLAKVYGVSYEAVRQVVKKLKELSPAADTTIATLQ
jgi:Mor family transcriptional regulator